MLTSKQRAWLRAQANREEIIAQVGKEGLSETCVSGVNTALEARELIKVRVLPNSGITARELCDGLCAALRAEPVQVIGTVAVIFRQKKKDSAFVLPKAGKQTNATEI